MKRLFIILLDLIWMANSMSQIIIPSERIEEKKVYQLIGVEVNNFQRLDSCIELDMNIDLSEVHLIPDCTIYLHPWIRSETDSLELPSIMINGPQSDLMYRRRKSLGIIKTPIPFVSIREGEHKLPRINYRKTNITYMPWMDSASIVIRDENCNCDARLIPFEYRVVKIEPRLLVQTDTIVIHDTVRINRLVTPTVPKKKEVVIQHAGYIAKIYFPVRGLKILPEHELNHDAWHTFVSEIDSLRKNSSNTLLGITVTGYSSPEGSYASNDIIAKQRALALKKYLETVYDPSLVEIRTEWFAEDWDGLEKVVSESDMKDKDLVLKIIASDDINGREIKLKRLSSGITWKYMLKNFFPKLRCATCRIGYTKQIVK